MTRTVYVVDDEPELRGLMEEALQAEGYKVRGFPDGEAVLEGLEEDPLPDAVLLDINMPGLSGWDVRERMAGDPRTEEIPVIAVTAQGGASVENLAREGLGFLDYVRKPFRLDDLLGAIERATGETEQAQQAADADG